MMTDAEHNPTPERPSASGDQFDAELDGFPTASADSADHGRDPLEMLLSEFLERVRSGKPADVEHFANRHPQLAEEIRDFFPLVLSMEEQKRRNEQSLRRADLARKLELDRLGPYRFVRELGRGGMGIVFEAVPEQTPDTQSDGKRERVAVKVLSLPASEEARTAKLFRKEAEIARSLRHRNIVPVRAFGCEDDLSYYEMPLVRGVSLALLIERLRNSEGVVYAEEIARQFGAGAAARRKSDARRVPSSERRLARDSWRNFAIITLQVCQALGYAHRKGLVHRDVKPANLLLDHDGNVWVTDFGLAVMTGQEDGEAAFAESVGGTLRYMAPEQLRGQPDPRSDLYALGLTLYELITLHDAHPPGSRAETIERIVSGGPIPSSDLRPDAPSALHYIIGKAISAAPESRYQSATEMSDDLRRYLNGLRVPKPRGVMRLVEWWEQRRKRKAEEVG